MRLESACNTQSWPLTRAPELSFSFLLLLCPLRLLESQEWPLSLCCMEASSGPSPLWAGGWAAAFLHFIWDGIWDGDWKCKNCFPVSAAPGTVGVDWVLRADGRWRGACVIFLGLSLGQQALNCHGFLVQGGRCCDAQVVV